MTKTIRPITAYAVIKTKTMKLKAYDIFPDKDVVVDKKEEKIIRVTITPCLPKKKQS